MKVEILKVFFENSIHLKMNLIQLNGEILIEEILNNVDGNVIQNLNNFILIIIDIIQESHYIIQTLKIFQFFLNSHKKIGYYSLYFLLVILTPFLVSSQSIDVNLMNHALIKFLYLFIDSIVIKGIKIG